MGDAHADFDRSSGTKVPHGRSTSADSALGRASPGVYGPPGSVPSAPPEDVPSCPRDPQDAARRSRTAQPGASRLLTVPCFGRLLPHHASQGRTPSLSCAGRVSAKMRKRVCAIVLTASNNPCRTPAVRSS